LTKTRRVIAQRLQKSKVTAPHFYVNVTADATAITRLKDSNFRLGNCIEIGEKNRKINRLSHFFA
jgi:pyruvate/2-oxoglutarate dehydrogenase complex dihydrolipoamide acyltransferase (E2) component